MSRRPALRPLILLLPVALMSTAPVVHWCARDWDQVCARGFLACAAGMGIVFDDCPAQNAADACPRAASMDSGGDVAGCDDADAGGTCPIESRAVNPGDSAPPPGRAYVLGDPHSGVRPVPPRVDPLRLLAVVIAATTVEPAGPVCIPAPAPAARPPTHPWRRRPPARAPPLA